jgi:hypothetical protein
MRGQWKDEKETTNLSTSDSSHLLGMNTFIFVMKKEFRDYCLCVSLGSAHEVMIQGMQFRIFDRPFQLSILR